MSKPQPNFEWDAPNIHSLLGVDWVAQHRTYLPIPEGSDDWQRPLGSWQEGGLAMTGCKPATGWKMPSGPGEGFYKCLRKLGYQKGPDGDYR